MALIQLKDVPAGCSRCVALRCVASPHTNAAAFPVARRVIGYLLRDVVAEEGNSDEALTVSLPVSKATIASRPSLTPEILSRVLHELEVADLVHFDKRDVHNLDPKRLASYPGP